MVAHLKFVGELLRTIPKNPIKQCPTSCKPTSLSPIAGLRLLIAPKDGKSFRPRTICILLPWELPCLEVRLSGSLMLDPGFMNQDSGPRIQEPGARAREPAATEPSARESSERESEQRMLPVGLRGQGKTAWGVYNYRVVSVFGSFVETPQSKRIPIEAEERPRKRHVAFQQCFTQNTKASNMR